MEQNEISGIGRSIYIIIISSLIIFNIYYYYNYIKDIPETNIQYIDNGVNHYKLVQLGSLRRDQYLLDRKTGRVWQMTCMGGQKDGHCLGEVLWNEMRVENKKIKSLEELGIPTIRPSQMKRIQTPDGKIWDIPEQNVQAALARGGKVVR